MPLSSLYLFGPIRQNRRYQYTGMAFSWMGEGFSKPNSVMALTIS